MRVGKAEHKHGLEDAASDSAFIKVKSTDIFQSRGGSERLKNEHTEGENREKRRNGIKKGKNLDIN